MAEPTLAAVKAELRANPEPLIAWAAAQIAYLGSLPEWSMEDNFLTTESLVQVAESYDLPEAGDQGPEALRFWRTIVLNDLGIDNFDDDDGDLEDDLRLIRKYNDDEEV